MIKLVQKYSNTFVSKWLVLFLDTLIIGISFFIASFVHFNFELNYIEPGVFKYHLFVVVMVRVISFFAFNTYSGIVRHTSFEDASALFKAIGLSSILLSLFTFLDFKMGGVYLVIPLSVILIDFFIAIFSLIFTRFLIKMSYDKLVSNFKDEKLVLIYGAGHLGRITKNTFVNDKRLKYTILGFIDDNPQLIGKSVEGVTVFSHEKAKEKFLKGKNTPYPNLEVVFAIQSISSFRKTEIIDSLLEDGITLKILPPIRQWMNGKLQVSQIHQVRIEDLLEREAIKLNNLLVNEYLNNKVVLVTGAAGSIGSELVRQIVKFNPRKLILVDQSESGLYDLETELKRLKYSWPLDLDVVIRNVVNKARMDKTFEKYRPEVIFHAAAYKHVPLMENDPYKAVEVNVFGTKNLADLALKYSVSRFVFISTDKAVNPTNIMGATKRLAEMYVRSLNVQQNQTRFITTRFGNVLGSNGSVIPLFKRQIEAGGPVTVTHPDIIRYFMTIPEACQLVLEAGTMGKGGEIFVFEMGEPVKILNLAKRMIRLSGFEPNVDMEINITGLRPGEKLYEELLSDAEKTGPTHHPKILIARVKPRAIEELKLQLDTLEKSMDTMNTEEIVKTLKAIIPEFVSNNSPFSDLDVDSIPSNENIA